MIFDGWGKCLHKYRVYLYYATFHSLLKNWHLYRLDKLFTQLLLFVSWQMCELNEEAWLQFWSMWTFFRCIQTLLSFMYCYIVQNVINQIQGNSFSDPILLQLTFPKLTINLRYILTWQMPRMVSVITFCSSFDTVVVHIIFSKRSEMFGHMQLPSIHEAVFAIDYCCSRIYTGASNDQNWCNRFNLVSHKARCSAHYYSWSI